MPRRPGTGRVRPPPRHRGPRRRRQRVDLIELPALAAGEHGERGAVFENAQDAPHTIKRDDKAAVRPALGGRLNAALAEIEPPSRAGAARPHRPFLRAAAEEESLWPRAKV